MAIVRTGSNCVRAITISLIAVFASTACAQMVLVAPPARGFTLTTYASGYPETPGGNDGWTGNRGAGPLGIAFRTDGQVLVVSGADQTIRLQPNHIDGQAAGPVSASHAGNPIVGLAQIWDGSQFHFYSAQRPTNNVVELQTTTTAASGNMACRAGRSLGLSLRSANSVRAAISCIWIHG